jgi:hypothetical protein
MRRRSIAIALWAATVAAAILATLLVIATRDTPVPASWGFRGASEAFGVACGTVGAIVAVRRPDNVIGWLFLVIGLCFATQALVNEYVVASTFTVAGGLPATTFLAWTLTWSWVPPVGIALIFLPLLFPTGHLLTPRWRIVAVLGAVAIVAFGAAAAFIPGPIQQAVFIDNPFTGHGLDRSTYATAVFGPASLLLVTVIGLSMGSLVLRFRRASTETRQQIKWFALAALIAASTFTLYVTVSFVELASATKLLEILSVLSLIGIPAAAGMAILRYRLYDIDRIISRTIGYAVVTAVLFAAFIVVNLVLQNVITRLTGDDSPLTVAISTLVVAVLFAPVRARVQAVVDRRFHRARYDAERTTLAFAERLRDQVDLPTLAGDLDATVQAVIAPASIGLWLRGSGR